MHGNEFVRRIKNLLGEEDECAKEMEKLFVLARAYGIEDWLVFDASVVRGLAYYTGLFSKASTDEAS